MACNCTDSILSNCSNQDLLELAGIISSLGCGPLGTNLTYMPDPTGGTMSSSTGTPAFIPLVNDTNAGLISPELYAMILNSATLAHPAVTVGVPANGLSIDLATQVLNLALASSTSTGALSSTDWNIFNNKQDALGYIAENIANKQNSMAVDGTGIKYPTVDAVNLQADRLARATTNIGFADVEDTFELYAADDFTLGIPATSIGIIFPEYFKIDPPAPSDALKQITPRTIPLSNIVLPTDGIFIRFVGYQANTNSILFGETPYIQSKTVAQLGIVVVKRVGGVNSFLSPTRNVLTMPDVAAYSNLEISSTGLTSNVIIDNAGTNLQIKNTAGTLIGISVNWHGQNNDVKQIPAQNPTTFVPLHPGLALNPLPPPSSTDINPTLYWNGTAIVALPTPISASIQRFLINVYGVINVQYGETVYDNIDAAKDNVWTQSFTNVLPDGTFTEIGRLVVQRNTTNLGDSTQAVFYTSGGGAGGSSGGSLSYIPENIDNKGQPGGYAALDSNGTVPMSQDTRFTVDIPVVLASGKTLGKYVNGQTIPAIGKTTQEVLLDIALEYLNPVFTSFDVTGQPTTVEVGTTLSGAKIFSWSIAQNSGVIGTVDIIDNNTSTVLVDDTPNDGSQSATVNSITLNFSGSTQSWKLLGNNSNGPSVNSGNFVVTALFNRYWGATPTLITDPSDGTNNRLYVLGLPNRAFKTSGTNTFTLVTGTTYKDFVVILPPGVTITSVVDTGNLNANLTQYYILSSVTIKDAGGTDRAYNQYTLRLGAPYPISTNHVITTT